MTQVCEGDVYYHGGSGPVHVISPNWYGADGELLCASASVNVALRYGSVVSKFVLNPNAHVLRIPLSQLFAPTTPSFDCMRAEGMDAVLVAPSSDSFDFPAATVFVLRADALRFVETVSPAMIAALDDGLSTVHAPVGPQAPGWSVYVADVYSGNEAAALDDIRELAEVQERNERAERTNLNVSLRP